MSDKERPDCFIQWKGTNACIDLYCTCGEQFHFDGYFAYELTCGHCGQTYELPNTLRVYPVEPSRQLTLCFDEQVSGFRIQHGKGAVFTVRWPRQWDDAVEPGGTFEIHDGESSAYVKLVKVETGGESAVLTVENIGVKP